MRQLATQFKNLFEGYRGAYGTYFVQEEYSLKKKGKGRTVKGANVTVDLWLLHLQGQINSGIGIIPINEESQCYWGAIDIDMYQDFDVFAFAKEVKDTPLVICRSKSGGAHCFMFVKQPIPARLMQTRLREIAASLGYAGSEIFPKQVQRKSDTDVGNWLNMPYFNAEEPTRYGIDGTGKKLSAEEFITYAMSKRIDNEKKVSDVSVKMTIDEEFDKLFSTGAPCHEAMYRRGIKETVDGRNNCLYTIGQQFKRQRPDGWEELLAEFNKRFCSPSLSFGELTQITNSLKTGEGFYKCKDACCSAYCDKELCKARQYGVGDEAVMPNFTSLQKTGGKRDCLWYLTLDSSEAVELTTDELLSPAKVRGRILEEMDAPILMPEISAKDWRKILDKLFENSCEVIEDVTTGEDIFYDYVEEFCNGQRKGKMMCDVFDGKPVEEMGYVWFRMVDFKNFLVSKKYPTSSPQAISSKLRSRYLAGQQVDYCKYHKDKAVKIQGDFRKVNLWAYPTEKCVQEQSTLDIQEDVQELQPTLHDEIPEAILEQEFEYTNDDEIFKDFEELINDK